MKGKKRFRGGSRTSGMWSTVVAFAAAGLLTVISVPADSAEAAGIDTWMQYVSAEAAGFDQGGLDEARAHFDRIGGAAGLLVVDGAIVANWGDTNRRFFDASIRKSYLNALIGMAVADGDLQLDRTLADLGIDDRLGLSAAERTATVADLLGARSGVYHPGAFEADAWKARRPARGAYAPGEHWFYNNWDFNVLGHIYEAATGVTIGQAFADRIAGPLGFQDFRPLDFTYFEEPDVSDYPAYLFRTTARDMARFGVLYLNYGRWGSRQIVPERWVTASLAPRSLAFSDGTQYGYLWWYYELDGRAVHYAHGAPGQGVFLVPDLKLVFVFRPNTYGPTAVNDCHIRQLLRLLFDARVSPQGEIAGSAGVSAAGDAGEVGAPGVSTAGEVGAVGLRAAGHAGAHPASGALARDVPGGGDLRPAEWPERLLGADPASAGDVQEYFGVYLSNAVGPITFLEEGGTVYFSVNRGTFRVLARGTELIVEDIEAPLRFIADNRREGTAQLAGGRGGPVFEIYVRSNR